MLAFMWYVLTYVNFMIIFVSKYVLNIVFHKLQEFAFIKKRILQTYLIRLAYNSTQNNWGTIHDNNGSY